MSDDITWMKDLSGEYDMDKELFVCTQNLFDRIMDYTGSQPTGPSPGRIYKKNFSIWPDKPDWYVFICEADGDFVSHIPRKLEVV